MFDAETNVYTKSIKFTKWHSLRLGLLVHSHRVMRVPIAIRKKLMENYDFGHINPVHGKKGGVGGQSYKIQIFPVLN